MDDKEFKVVDKRRFSEEGAKEDTADNKKEAAPEPLQQDLKTASAPLPPVDFSTFILSMSTSVLFHLGEIPDPQTNKTDKNLDMARHTIDIIDMLKQKTKGNLDDNESMLLDNILYNLRIRFVNKTLGASAE